MHDCKIDIMGESWLILIGNEKKYPALEGRDGYTDSSIREIVIEDMEYAKKNSDARQDMENYQKSVLRHELIHAYLFESGLDGSGKECAHWELNEEMIDWIAIQSPKIFKTFQELNLL